MSTDDLTEDPALREVYAWYGAAALDANSLDLDLVVILLMLARLDNPRIPAADLAKRDETLDKHTMGQLLKALRAVVVLPRETDELLTQALANRNDLAHHFWHRECEKLHSPKGCAELVAQLRSLSASFRSVLRHTSGIVSALARRTGVSEEAVHAEVRRTLGQPD